MTKHPKQQQSPSAGLQRIGMCVIALMLLLGIGIKAFEIKINNHIEFNIIIIKK